MSIPCAGRPDGGWGAVAFIDGTGAIGDLDASMPPFSLTGRVVAEIPPLYGRTRLSSLDPGQAEVVASLGFTDESLPDLLFYNLLNPPVARTNVFQQAAEHLVLLRALRGFHLDGSTIGSTGTIEVDPAKVSAAGHSQGAQTLPLVAWADPKVAAVVSSSGSGGYYHQFAHGRDKREALAQLVGDEQLLDELNPVLHVAQTAMDAADPQNYPNRVDYLNVAGLEDGCAVIESARSMATGTGLDTADRRKPKSIYGAPSLDSKTVDLPASANRDGRTRVSVETTGGHFVALFDKGPGTAFLDAVDRGARPTVEAGIFADPDTQPSCAGRWDDPSDRFGEG